MIEEAEILARPAQRIAASLESASLLAHDNWPASMHNLTGECMKSLLKLDIAHIPYKGIGPAGVNPGIVARLGRALRNRIRSLGNTDGTTIRRIW